MQKDLYFVWTNGYNMVVSVDANNDCRYIAENNSFPTISEGDEKAAIEFLQSIEDDSSWDDDCTYQQLFEDHENDVKIVAKISKEI